MQPMRALRRMSSKAGGGGSGGGHSSGKHNPENVTASHLSPWRAREMGIARFIEPSQEEGR